MTRINVIPAALLADQHLLAEYRELPRTFPLAKAAMARGPLTVPAAYTLGKGHVSFFYPRTDWLSARQAELIQELLSRGYDLKHRTAPEPLPGEPSGWRPTEEARDLNLERLRERLGARPGWYTFWGKPVASDFYGHTHTLVDVGPCTFVAMSGRLLAQVAWNDVQIDDSTALDDQGWAKIERGAGLCALQLRPMVADLDLRFIAAKVEILTRQPIPL